MPSQNNRSYRLPAPIKIQVWKRCWTTHLDRKKMNFKTNQNDTVHIYVSCDKMVRCKLAPLVTGSFEQYSALIVNKLILIKIKKTQFKVKTFSVLFVKRVLTCFWPSALHHPSQPLFHHCHRCPVLSLCAVLLPGSPAAMMHHGTQGKAVT